METKSWFILKERSETQDYISFTRQRQFFFENPCLQASITLDGSGLAKRVPEMQWHPNAQFNQLQKTSKQADLAPKLLCKWQLLFWGQNDEQLVKQHIQSQNTV